MLITLLHSPATQPHQPPNTHQGISAIIGPQSAQSALHVQSICDAKEMPHIETRWDPFAPPVSSSLNVHPDPVTMGHAFVDLVKAFEWKSFTILYENGKLHFTRIPKLILLNPLFSFQHPLFLAYSTCYNSPTSSRATQ